MTERRRRVVVVLILLLIALGGSVYEHFQKHPEPTRNDPQVAQNDVKAAQTPAIQTLNTLEVKGRAPKAGYSRAQFDLDWDKIGTCDVRNHILKRDMTNVVVRPDTDCTVMGGTLNDPYTGKTINFVRGKDTSDDVQID